MATIKPKTNIPVVGTLKYVNYAKSKNPDWADQISLKGDWETEGEGTIYCPMVVKDQLYDLELISKPMTPDGERANDKYGNPAYTVRGNPRILLLKSEEVEDGAIRTKWQVKLCDTAGCNDQPSPKQPDEPPHPAERATSHTEDDAKQWATLRDRWVKSAKLALQAHERAELEVDNDRLAQTATAFFIEACRRNLT